MVPVDAWYNVYICIRTVFNLMNHADNANAVLRWTTARQNHSGVSRNESRDLVSRINTTSIVDTLNHKMSASRGRIHAPVHADALAIAFRKTLPIIRRGSCTTTVIQNQSDIRFEWYRETKKKKKWTKYVVCKFWTSTRCACLFSYLVRFVRY